MEIITTDYEMDDKSVVPLALNYGLLFKLRSKAKADYDRYNEMLNQSKKEADLSNAILIYTAYLCAYLIDHDDIKDSIGFEDFLFTMSQNRQYNGNIARDIYSPKR